MIRSKQCISNNYKVKSRIHVFVLLIVMLYLVKSSSCQISVTYRSSLISKDYILNPNLKAYHTSQFSILNINDVFLQRNAQSGNRADAFQRLFQRLILVQLAGKPYLLNV